MDFRNLEQVEWFKDSDVGPVGPSLWWACVAALIQGFASIFARR